MPGEGATSGRRGRAEGQVLGIVPTTPEHASPTAIRKPTEHCVQEGPTKPLSTPVSGVSFRFRFRLADGGSARRGVASGGETGNVIIMIMIIIIIIIIMIIVIIMIRIVIVISN